MITVSLNEVVSSVEGLKALLEVKLPIKIAYRIRKLVNNGLERELKNYDEARNKLICDLGEKQEDGTFSIKDPEKLKEFAKSMEELLTTKVEFDWELLKIEDLGEVQLASKDIVSWLFV